MRAGKIRYVGVSNFSGWQLRKSLAISEKKDYPRYVANQTYYSLVGRDYEWELMPVGQDQGGGRHGLESAGGRLTGKVRRDHPSLKIAASTKLPMPDLLLMKNTYTVVDVLDEIAEETGKSIPQIAINWLLQRPTVSSVIIGARNKKQLPILTGRIGDRKGLKGLIRRPFEKEFKQVT